MKIKVEEYSLKSRETENTNTGIVSVTFNYRESRTSRIESEIN